MLTAVEPFSIIIPKCNNGKKELNNVIVLIVGDMPVVAESYDF